MKFDKNWFFDLEMRLIAAGLDSDYESFADIKKHLQNKTRFDADEFARRAIYVILAGGFSQKTAKKVHVRIMDYLVSAPVAAIDNLFAIFHNKNKISAIVKIWENRQEYCNDYYKLKTLDEKVAYLTQLPHIGRITASHLARNLGENVFKPDVWIIRFADAFFDGDSGAMFRHFERETGLPRGYIDVVLWKGLQNHFIGIVERGCGSTAKTTNECKN